VTYNAVAPNKPGVPGSLASNTVNTEILSDSISKVLSSDKTTLKEGETVHNTVTVTNNSAIKLVYNFISNPTPDGATYVEGSIKVNGVSQPNKNMITGFFLPDLNPGETFTIEYDLQVNSPMTVSPVVDYSEFQYSVTDPAKGNVSFAENTNPVSIDVLFAKLNVVKSVDKAFAIKGDTLTYTITNLGNIDINDIYFTDNIPQGTTFVEKSVLINGSNIPGYRPDIGYNVSNLTPNSSTTTSFQVTLD
jgi:uncharacterized repeat protein (TIGR01451 family)